MKFAFLYLIGGKCKKFKFYLNKVYVHEFIIKMTCIFNCTCFLITSKVNVDLTNIKQH